MLKELIEDYICICNSILSEELILISNLEIDPETDLLELNPHKELDFKFDSEDVRNKIRLAENILNKL